MSIFDSQSLAGAVAKTLDGAGVTPDHRNAFALVATIDGGVQGALATRVGDGWSVALVGGVSKGRQFAGGVEVVRTW